jgi:DNA-binding NarL/FixJ family response regulator
MRVVIAEDGGLFRAALTRVLAEAGVEVVAAVGDADALWSEVGEAAMKGAPPDVAIVDVRMPPTFTDEGLRAAERIRAAGLSTGVLVLTQAADATHAVRLLADARGGIGYLLKDRVADVDELVDAVRRVAAGGTVVDPSVVAALVGRTRARQRLAVLTPREIEVLELMAEGRSNRGIAERLVVTEKTVETHVASILGKLGLEAEPDTHRRVLAVLAFLRAG